jgi:hypothetical protein
MAEQPFKNIDDILPKPAPSTLTRPSNPLPAQAHRPGRAKKKLLAQAFSGAL